VNVFNLFKKDKNENKLLNINSSNESVIREPITVKATKANKIFAENVSAPSTQNYITAYKNADIVYSCVSYAADIASQVKFKVYSEKNGKLVPYKDEKVKLWLKQPNPFQPMSELIYLYIQSYLLTGNAYLTYEKLSGRMESWVLNPSKVEIVPHPKKYIQGYLYDKKIAFKTDEIIFFKNSSLDSEYYGQSSLASLVDPLEIEGYGIDDLKNFYKNSLIAQGIFTSEYPLSKQQIDSLREQFRNLYGRNSSERFGFVITPNNLQYTSMKLTPKDAMLLDALGISEDRIYKVFRLNPILLGHTKNVNGTELKEAKQIYINNFIRPLLNRLKDTWEIFFRRVLKDDTFTIKLDFDSIPEINTVLEEKIDAVKQAISIGLLSIDEGRDILGFDLLNGKYTDSHLAASFLHGATPLDLETGETINVGVSNQQPKPQGSTNSNGGLQDGVSR